MRQYEANSKVMPLHTRWPLAVRLNPEHGNESMAYKPDLVIPAGARDVLLAIDQHLSVNDRA